MYYLKRLVPGFVARLNRNSAERLRRSLQKK